MSLLFVNILKQAFKTFDHSNQAAFNLNFSLLKQLTEQLNLNDLFLTKDFCENSFKGLDSAPCTYMHIFENDIVSMSVFVMRAGYTMPLHDHPMMYGLLRGIYGTMHVQSYTQKLRADEPLIYDRTSRQIAAYPEKGCFINSGTEAAVLTPRERNYHEITAINNGVAAFFDILSPPYDVDIPEHGSRRCRFYRTLPFAQKTESTLVILERIPTPLSYYCDICETPKPVSQSTFNYSKKATSSVS